ncbi:MFS transporter [Acinetobacter seifertii]|jgi:Arabinose efflux permease|uniref:MFS transporter n=1 Tax=Acinetobacter seifertii TaxID=1530123 RepID=A0ABX8L3K9_9GAMM|nr:MFS transporter [Acinetobacter seifertii]OCZ51535.1 MFS transporter [Acinetobacter seifertii]QXB46561.1 MFS transporter [Acinetobacter seifertii]
MYSVSKEKLWNRSFILCVLNNLFLFIYYYALLTILPLYILKELSGSISQAGLALTLFLISSIAIRPFAGLIIERLGEKTALRGSALLFAFLAFGYLFINQLWILLFIRFAHGIWFSILTTVTVPIVNEFIPEQRKGEGMGYFVMSTNLAVVFGPMIALATVRYTSFYNLFILLTLIVCLGLVFCFLIPVVSLKDREVVQVKQKISLNDIIERRVVPIGVIALFIAMAYSSIMSFISVYSETKHLLAETSIFFIIFAISMIIARPWVGYSYDKRGANSVVYPSFILFAVGLFLVSQIQTQWEYWFAAVLIGAGYGSLFPVFQTMAIQTVEKNRIGYAVSTFFTLFDLGMAIGSVLVGLIIAQIGYEKTYQLCAWVTIMTLFLYRWLCDRDIKTKIGI